MRGTDGCSDPSVARNVKDLTEKKHKIRAALIALRKHPHRDTSAEMAVLRDKMQHINERLQELQGGSVVRGRSLSNTSF